MSIHKIQAVYYSVLGGLSVAGSAIATALGGWDAGLQTLLIIMGLDYVFGVICALFWKRSSKTQDGAFESKASIKGLFRKCAMLGIVFLAYRLDAYANTTIVRQAVIMFFIGNEGLSIVETWAVMGVPMPDIVKNMFEAMKKKGEQAETKKE